MSARIGARAAASPQWETTVPGGWIERTRERKEREREGEPALLLARRAIAYP